MIRLWLHDCWLVHYLDFYSMEKYRKLRALQVVFNPKVVSLLFQQIPKHLSTCFRCRLHSSLFNITCATMNHSVVPNEWNDLSEYVGAVNWWLNALYFMNAWTKSRFQEAQSTRKNTNKSSSALFRGPKLINFNEFRWMRCAFLIIHCARRFTIKEVHCHCSGCRNCSGRIFNHCKPKRHWQCDFAVIKWSIKSRL